MLENTSVPGPNKRVCAYFIDICLVGLLGTVVSQVAGASVGSLLTGLLILFRDVLMPGGSPGKRLCGMQLVSADADSLDSAVTAKQSAIRNAIFALPHLAGSLSGFIPLLVLLQRHGGFLAYVIEYTFVRMRPDGRRLGDQWAGTQLLDLRPAQRDGVYLLYSLLVLAVALGLRMGLALVMTGGQIQLPRL